MEVGTLTRTTIHFNGSSMDSHDTYHKCGTYMEVNYPDRDFMCARLRRAVGQNPATMIKNFT